MGTRYEEAFIRQEYGPGGACEFDWGTVNLDVGGTGYRKYQMAVFTAAYSNNRYAGLYQSQDTAAFQEWYADYCAHCHGVFHQMTYNNMRVAVKKFVEPTEKESTDALTQLSLYYGFKFRFCNICSGNEKGHVERTVVEYVWRKAFSDSGTEPLFRTGHTCWSGKLYIRIYVYTDKIIVYYDGEAVGTMPGVFAI